MKNLAVIFFLFTSTIIHAQYQQKADSCFSAANDFFQKADYKMAGNSFYQSAKFEKSCDNPRIEDVYFELINAATCFKAINNIDQTKLIYSEIIHYFDSLGLQSNTTTARNELASICIDEGNNNKALDLLGTSISISRKSSNNEELSNSFLILTNYFILQQDKVKFFQYADSVLLSIADTTFEKHIQLNYNISKFYKQTGLSDSAEFYLKRCISYDRKAGKQIECADHLLEYGQLILRNKTSEALFAIDSSIAIFNSEKEFYGLATAYNTKGMILANNTTKTDAISCLNTALQIFSDIKNNKGKASVLINLADLKKNVGQYNEALDLLFKAYDIYTTENDIEMSNVALSNIGHIYITQSKYDKAIEIYEKLLRSPEMKEKSIIQAIIFNNIGSVYNAWGQYDRAVDYYKKALEIHQINNNIEEYAVALNNLGNVHEQNGQNEMAIEKYKEALLIFTKTNKKESISVTLNNIGGIYYNNLMYSDALDCYIKALKIAEESNNLKNIALLNDNLGNIYLFMNNFQEAKKCHEKALALRKQLGEMSGIASTLNNLAVTLIREEKYNEAINYLTESVTILESLRIAAKEDARKDYLNNQIFAYQNLIVSLIKTGDYNKAFYYNELSRSKQLAEQIAKSDIIQIPSLLEVQNSIDDKTAILIFATVDNSDMSTFLITKTTSKASTKNKEQLIRKLLDDNDIREIVISKLTFKEIELLNVFLNSSSNSLQYRLSNKIFSNVIKAYSSLLNSSTYKDVTKTKKLSNTIYNFLFAAHEQSLAGKNKLLIMQDGILGYLPFETLINNKRQYLINDFDISYTNSFSVRKLISNRTYPLSRNSMLAFGVSEYDKAIETPQQNYALNLNELRINIYKAIALDVPMDEYYNRIGYIGFNDLKESTNEVKNISAMFANSSYYLDSLCTENKIKQLSKTGILKQYKYIHFSTHGISVPEIPEMSSLILYKTQSKNSDEGYLQMGEIAKLELNSDFVNLSACETGLGKIYSGEGVVGLTQAFISAGANKISVSLWQVDESSTAEFMKNFYSKAIANNYDFSRAMNEVKREFISGKHGVAWRLPYFWAPFVIYGE